MALFNRTVIRHEAVYDAFESERAPQIDDPANRPESLFVVASVPAGALLGIKRAFDIAFSLVALALSAPIIGVAAAAIKIDSRGPVFFVQERIGLNRRRGDRRAFAASVETGGSSGAERRRNVHPGRPFKIYKLRTMRLDAERFGPALACEHDPRITRVGRFIRKMRIDELPQFLNVLQGDMSIIGPRPERSFFINRARLEVPQFPMRLLVKPGITGLAQVENGYTSSIDEMRRKLFYDLSYIRDFSLRQEIEILFKTVFVVVTGKGAC